MEALSPNVCFTPKSGHWLSMSGCPLCAKSRHQRALRRRYFFLTLPLSRHHNCSACDRHLGQCERRLWLGRHFRRWRVQDGRPEPRIEGMTAAVPSRHRRLSLALAIVWTGKADVKMFGMSPPRSYLGEPAPVCSGLAAHLLLDRGVHENARDA